MKVFRISSLYTIDKVLNILSYLSSFRLWFATVGSVGPRPNAVRIAGASVARVQLQTFDASIHVTLIQFRDGLRIRRIYIVSAHLVQTALAAPHAIVRGLHARDAVGEELTELSVRRHAAWRPDAQTFHINLLVFLVVEHVLRYLRDLQTSTIQLMPHALHAYPGIQALILICEILAIAGSIPAQ